MIKRFKLKNNAEEILAEFSLNKGSASYIHKEATRSLFKEIVNDISVCIGFPEDLSEWNDFDFVLVLDEMSGQPYFPFYSYMNEPNNPRFKFPFLISFITAYNKYMSELPFLEEIEND